MFNFKQMTQNEINLAMDNIGLLVNSPEYIESHLKYNVKTDDIANACYCSRSTPEKLFHYVYHISVHDYIVRRKMMLPTRHFRALLKKYGNATRLNSETRSISRI